MRKIMIILIMAALFILSACNNNETSSQVEEVFATPVAVSEAYTGSLSGSNHLTGIAQAGSDIAVMPKSAGEIVEIFVSQGEQVEKGQTLARLANRDQELALEADVAGVRQAQNAVERAQVGLTQAKHNSEQAKSNLESAERQLATAALNQERMKALYDEGLISLREFEEVENAFIAAETQVEQAKINLKNAESAIINAEISVSDAQVGVEQRRIAVDISEKRLSETEIKAPVAGQISTLDFEEGDMVSNQAAFARIISVDFINVDLAVSAEQRAMFEVGKQLPVHFSGVPNEQAGIVTFISPSADQSGLFEVEVQVENPEQKILPGMVATVNVEETLVADSLIVPTAAVIERQDIAYIFVVVDDKVVEKEVEVIRYDTDLTAIEGEISEGDKVVIKGQNLLSDGDLIRIVEEEN